MALIHWSPVWEPFSDMDEMFNRMPSVSGVNQEDVKESGEKGVLTIQGESKKEHEVEEKNYYRKEVRSGAFYREVALPAPVMENKVEASFEDGMLKITAPKATPSEAKKIDVKVVKKNK